LNITDDTFKKIAFSIALTNALIFIMSIAMKNDFTCFYIAIQFLDQFSLAEMYDADKYVKFMQNSVDDDEILYHWFYPPHYILQLYVFGFQFLSFAASKAIFIGTEYFLLIATLYIICKNKAHRVNIIFFIMATPLCLIALGISQNSFYSLSFLIIGLYCIDKKPILSGLCFALLTYKPQFAILIPIALLLTSNYRVFFYAALFFLLQVIASIVIFGIEPWVAFFQTTHNVWSLMHSNQMPVHIMSSHFSAFTSLNLSLEYTKILSLFSFLCIASIALYFWYTRKGDHLAKAILCAGICLGTPYIFHYDMIILIGSVVFYMGYNRFVITDREVIEMILFCIFYILILILSVLTSTSMLILASIIMFIYMVNKALNNPILVH